jgi:hypothetical protein
VEVVAHLFTDGLDDLVQEAVAVAQRAAVIVLAVVDAGAEELGEEIAVGSVQLDAVETRLARPAGALGEHVDQVLDLVRGGGLAEQPVEGVVAARRRQPLVHQVLDATHVPLPARVAELHDELAVVLVDLLADFAPEGDPVVVVDHRVVRQDAAAAMNGYERRDDGADAPAGELLFPVDARLVARAVVVVPAAGDARPEQAVLDGQVPELERLEDRVVVHGLPTSFRSGPSRPLDQP